MNHGRVVAATCGAFMALVVFVGWRVVPGIEANLESSVLRALSVRGIEVASIDAEGRTINVLGGPESPEQRLILAAAARSVPGVRRVRSPLVVPGQAAWQSDPVRIAQAERDVPARREHLDEAPGAAVTSLDEGVRGPGSGGSGGGANVPTVPAAGPARAASSAGEDPVEPAPAQSEVVDGAPDQAASPTPEAGNSEERLPERAVGPATPSGCEARLTVLAEGRTVVFAPGESALAQQDRRALEEIAGVLGGCGEWALTIVGYAEDDERDGVDSWELADRRARAIARYLTGRGIDASRLATIAGSAAFDEVGEPRAELYVTGGL